MKMPPTDRYKPDYGYVGVALTSDTIMTAPGTPPKAAP